MARKQPSDGVLNAPLNHCERLRCAHRSGQKVQADPTQGKDRRGGTAHPQMRVLGTPDIACDRFAGRGAHEDAWRQAAVDYPSKHTETAATGRLDYLERKKRALKQQSP